MFDLDKVNVVNYSMGGRSMRAKTIQKEDLTMFCIMQKKGDFVLIHSAHTMKLMIQL